MWRLSICCILCFAGVVAADDIPSSPNPDEAVSSIERRISALWKVHLEDEAAERQLKGLWDKMGGSLGTLKQTLREATNVPRPYVESLADDGGLLDLVIQGNDPAPVKVDICQAVSDDLSAKASTATARSRVAGPRPFDLMTVKAHTWDGPKEEKGFEVWYSKMGWPKNDKTHHIRFDRLSTPSERDLPPGRYWMWTYDGAHDGRWVPVTLSDDNMKDSEDVDLPIPSNPTSAPAGQNGY